MTAVSITRLMSDSGVAFGTSGARGLVTHMTDRVCMAYTFAFLQYLQEQGEYRPGMSVALAGDLRASTPRILAACIRAIELAGGKPKYCGHIPSPALSLFGYTQRIPSLMVTGSHIPDDRNGIKFNRAGGEVLKSDEAGIRAQSVDMEDRIFDAHGALIEKSNLPAPTDVSAPFVQRYTSVWGPQSLEGMRVGVYEHSSVGRDLLSDLIERLGAQVVRLGRSERFIPVDTEAIRPEDDVLARRWVGEHRLDAIVSTDGDADRPLLADETGQWMRGDVLGLLCARVIGSHTVVTPVSSNTALEKSGWFTRTLRTRIGSPYVIEAMNGALASGERQVCGYEANGGFLLADDHVIAGQTLAALPTRDAFLPIIAVLAHARARRSAVSALTHELPARFTHSDRLQNCPTADSRSYLERLRGTGVAQALETVTEAFGPVCGAAAALDETDGMRVTFANDEVVHLRPSGNAPELRCYSEADTPQRAREINERALAVVSTWLQP